MFNREEALKDKNSAARYFAWVISKRYVKAKGGDPSGKFWNESPWNKYYGQQCMVAFSLLNHFSPRAIDAALNRKDCSWQYTLREKKLKTAIQEEQKKIDHKAEQIKRVIEKNEDVVVSDVNSLPKARPGKKSKINRLK